MTNLFVRHSVTDFETWKSGFDDHGTVRREYGLTDVGLYRGADDPNDVTIILATDDVPRGEEFIASDDLRETMGASASCRRPTSGSRSRPDHDGNRHGEPNILSARGSARRPSSRRRPPVTSTARWTTSLRTWRRTSTPRSDGISTATRRCSRPSASTCRTGRLRRGPTPTQILSNETSALIRMVDTPELFGGELRILAAVDFADGKIVRWVDYWDSSSFDDDLYLQFRTPAEHFPTDLKDGDVATQATPDLVEPPRPRCRTPSPARMPRPRPRCSTPMSCSRTWRCVSRCSGGSRPWRISTGLSTTPRTVDRARCATSWAAATAAGSNGPRTPGRACRHHRDRTRRDGLVTRITSVYDSRQLAPDRSAALRAASFAP